MSSSAPRCALFLPNKKRLCKFEALAGSRYCVHHEGSCYVPSAAPAEAHGVDGASQARVPCPLDPRHSVFAHKLAQHLRACNRQKALATLHRQAWYSEGMHAAPRASVLDACPVDLRALFTRIRAAHATLASAGVLRSEGHQALAAGESHETSPTTTSSERAPEPSRASPAVAGDALEERAAVDRGLAEPDGPAHEAEPASGRTRPLATAQKHAAQCSALAARILRAVALGGTAVAFVEFGAGNASLTEAVANALDGRDPAAPRAQLVLIDRAVPRRKSDARLRELGHAQLARLRTDICDVDLTHVQQLDWSRDMCRCAMAKHLCGEATDLALHCLVRSASTPAPPAVASPLDDSERAAGGVRPCCAVDHVLIATCCHHRCRFESYVNRAALVEWGLAGSAFPVVCALSHWAVATDDRAGQQAIAAKLAGGRGAREGDGDGDGACEHAGGCLNEVTALGRLVAEQRIAVGATERRALGVMAKELLDAGRALFLAASGYESAWVEREFVPKAVTPENRLLRAERRVSKREARATVQQSAH
ncbi:hypothetical protein KFE25_001946 [Diacronema lutheri]|uniref:tRNA:m(4)X modification enzyme TRM13 n=1 Tax=Diacronema lutheri TaxID=2081491 RepID=A0A8J6CDS9_DIALT|nr:hypothetical protein KFE25_001946 [Diacronema lutheri]